MDYLKKLTYCSNKFTVRRIKKLIMKILLIKLIFMLLHYNQCAINHLFSNKKVNSKLQFRKSFYAIFRELKQCLKDFDIFDMGILAKIYIEIGINYQYTN